MKSKFSRLILVVVLLIVAPFLIAARPLQSSPPDLTDLFAVLAWLAGAGAPYLVGWVLSLLAENLPAWHKLSPGVKFVIPLILSPLVSVGATLLLQQESLLQLASPWYTIVAGSILGYLGTQQAYLSAKRAGYGLKAKWGRPSYVQGSSPE